MALTGRIIQNQIPNNDTFVDLVNVTGRGILKVVGDNLYYQGSVAREVEIIIDGVTVYSGQLANIAKSYIGVAMKNGTNNQSSLSASTGNISASTSGSGSSSTYSAVLILNIPFNSSLVVKGKCHPNYGGFGTYLVSVNYILEV